MDSWLVLELAAYMEAGRLEQAHGNRDAASRVLSVLATLGTNRKNEARDKLHMFLAEHPYAEDYGKFDDATVHVRILHNLDRHAPEHKDDRCVTLKGRYYCEECKHDKGFDECLPLVNIETTYCAWDEQMRVHGDTGDQLLADSQKTDHIRIKSIEESVLRTIYQPAFSRCLNCQRNTLRRTVDRSQVVMPRLLVTSASGRHKFGWEPKLSVGGIEYLLAGLVAKSETHYITVFRRNNKWFQYNDLFQNNTSKLSCSLGVLQMPNRFRPQMWYYTTRASRETRTRITEGPEHISNTERYNPTEIYE